MDGSSQFQTTWLAASCIYGQFGRLATGVGICHAGVFVPRSYQRHTLPRRLYVAVNRGRKSGDTRGPTRPAKCKGHEASDYDEERGEAIAPKHSRGDGMGTLIFAHHVFRWKTLRARNQHVQLNAYKNTCRMNSSCHHGSRPRLVGSVW